MTNQLLKRYYANQVTPEEARTVLDWFDTEAGQLHLTNRLDTQLGQADWHAPPNTSAPDAQRMLNAILQRQGAITPIVPMPIIRQISWWTRPMHWAAVLVGTLLLATGAFFGYRYLNPADLIRQTAFGKNVNLNLI